MANNRPHPSFSEKQMKLITVKAYEENISKADVIRMGVKKLFGTLTEEEVQKKLKFYEGLSDEERKHPEK